MKNLLILGFLTFALISCSNEPKSESGDNDSALVNIEPKSEIVNDDVVQDKDKTNDESAEFYITNDGIAGLKLGMKPDEIASELPDLEYEQKEMEIEQVTIHRIKKDGKFICSFEFGEDNKIYHIFVGDEYKTREGIGTFSTVKEVAKVYTIEPYKIVEGAEGMPFICLTIKEMPNLQMWLDVDVPEDYYTDEKKLLANVPETSKITDIYIESKE